MKGLLNHRKDLTFVSAVTGSWQVILNRGMIGSNSRGLMFYSDCGVSLYSGLQGDKGGIRETI